MATTENWDSLPNDDVSTIPEMREVIKAWRWRIDRAMDSDPEYYVETIEAWLDKLEKAQP